MGWFKKNKEGKEQDDIPSLPELPRLPELPGMNSFESFNSSQMQIPQLPSYPKSSFGEKFSQSAIKDAVSGEEEDEEELELEDLEETAPVLQKKSSVKEMNKEELITRKILEKRSTGREPVFVRLDKFEDSMKLFDEAKNKIMEMEKMLRENKRVKEAEEKELQEWESEIQGIKGQFEKIDRDIFSKVY